MHHVPHGQQLRLLLASLLIVGICGCQRSYSYVLHGIVKKAKDGTGLGKVLVTLKADGVTHQTGLPFTTEGDGSFRGRFSISDGEFLKGMLPKWSLILTRDGFHDEEVEISPTRQPGGQDGQIGVVAYMREKQ